MSESSIRGKSYELKIAKITRQKLRLEVKRDTRSGAGDWHKEDLRDRYNEVPLAIECKNQEMLKPKEWWRDADAKASFGQMPAVVFPMETEDLVLMRYTDVLQLIREVMDYRAEIADLRRPPISQPMVPVAKSVQDTVDQLERVAAQQVGKCREGHITDAYDRCMSKGCKYSRGYRPPKQSANGGKSVKARNNDQ